MGRLAATAFVLVLVGLTAGAFALTDAAKLELSPIYATHVSKVFSPACSCPTGEALIDFRLRRPDRVTVWVQRDGAGREATLVPGRQYSPGPVALVFRGITDDGLTLPDGVYRPVVHLARSHRTIRLPDAIRLDATPPAVRVAIVKHTIISPDGDGRNDAFAARVALSEPGRAILLVDGRRAVVARGPVVRWNGRVNGRAARPRQYVLSASATDAAGNVAKGKPFAIVQVRYVSLGRKRVVVRPGGYLSIRVSADAARVRWLLHGRSGLARPGTLRLRAPRSQGVFRLYVTAAGHTATASVVVA